MASVYSDYTLLGLSFGTTMKDDSRDINYSSGVEDSYQPVEIYEGECTCILNNFILLAEFSEVKGPVSLMTIPCTKKLDLDMDDFILKIMAIDYQAAASGHLHFHMDTEVLQTDVTDGVHAYIHYFNLNDVKARGFVRPMCLAYVSRDRRKLETKLALLRMQFLKVSAAMKEENRVLFLEEVSLGLQQLKDLQWKYFQWKQRLEEEEEEGEGAATTCDDFIASLNLDQLVEQQTEFNKILQSARSILEDMHLGESLSPWKDTFSVSEIPQVEEYMSYVKVMVGNHEPLILQQRRGDSTTELRPIAALSPFGVAIGLWYLCKTHQQFDSCDLELRGGCFWGPGEEEMSGSGDKALLRSPESCRDEVQAAMGNNMYLQLLLQLLPTHISLSYGNTPKDFDDSDYQALIKEGVQVATSGNEASSNYYSAVDSMNEGAGTSSFKIGSKTELATRPNTMLNELGHTLPLESIPKNILRSGKQLGDDDSSSESCELDDDVSEFQEFPEEELWCRCIWSGNFDSDLIHPGNKILHFFQTFTKVAQHILYSLLIGRTVVIAGSSSMRPKIWKIIAALIYFVPVEKDAKYLRWHRGILVSAHIEKYKVIGLCVPERLTVHDMISPRDKNAVTILDVNAKMILGPAYSGLLLADVRENFDQNFLCSEALVLFLQSVFAGIRQKVFLYKALSLTQPKLKNFLAKDVMHTLGVKGRDLDIINYLKQFIHV